MAEVAATVEVVRGCLRAKAWAWSGPSASLVLWSLAFTVSACHSSGLIPILVGSRRLAWRAQFIGVLTVAMFLCLFHAYTYSVIGAAMPRRLPTIPWATAP